MIRTVVAALALTALTGCDRPPDGDLDLVTNREVELKVDKLNERADALDKKVGEAPAGAAGAAAPDAAKMKHEQDAFETWKTMMQAREANDIDKVKEIIAVIERDFADTRAIVEIQDTKLEIEAIGKDAVPLEVDKWFVGKTSMDEGKATVLVFWEVWCPHCQREVPKLQETYDRLHGKGLNMVGITQVTNGKTDDDVKAFLDEHSVSYPIAKTGQSIPDHYNVRGIPAAAVVKDGKVIWRGHPAMLTDEMLQGFIGT